ncbi:MAG: TIGR02186 family protein [Pseudomonadota bacterium]
MMIKIRLLFLFLIFACSTSAAASMEKLQMGVSVDLVPVSSGFSGQDIVIFGSIENAEQAPLYRGEYDVIVEVIGEMEEAVVRKKERIGGIWVNAAAREYTGVPSYYSVLSRNNLGEVSDLSVLNNMGVGVDNLKARPVDRGNIQEFLTQGEFSSALRRIRIEQGLFSEDSAALEQLSPSLFRATLSLPPNVPIGVHTVKAYLFRDGKKLDEIENSFQVRKVGFERWMYDFAHNQSLLYGIMCVFLAIFTGWAANAIFRKN